MENPDIVILHGWGLSSLRFKPLTDALTDAGYRVHTPDFPGFSEETLPDHPLDLGDYTAFLHRYLEENGIRHPVIIAHSFGGRVTLRYVHEHPHAVRAVVFTGTPGYSSANFVRLHLVRFVAKLGHILFTLPLLLPMATGFRNVFYYALGIRDYSRARAVMRDTFRNVLKEDLVPYMRGMKIPVLLLWGKDDPFVPQSVARRMRHTIAHAELKIIPGNHGVPYKNAPVFAREAVQFIQHL